MFLKYERDLEAANKRRAARFVVVVKYPSGDERYLTSTGALVASEKDATRFKEMDAEHEAKTIGAAVRPAAL